MAFSLLSFSQVSPSNLRGHQGHPFHLEEREGVEDRVEGWGAKSE